MRSRAGTPQALQGCTVCSTSPALLLGVRPGGSGGTTVTFLPPGHLHKGLVWQERLQVGPGGWQHHMGQKHSLQLGSVCV